MKRIATLFFIFLTIPFYLFSQNSKVTSGVLEYNMGNYAEAVVKLEEALANKDRITKSSNVAKAHYFLCESLLRQSNGTTELDKPDQLTAASYLQRASEQMKLVSDHPDGGKYMAMAQDKGTTEQLWARLYNAGVGLFNDRKDQLANQLFVEAVHWKPSDFLTNRMLATSYLTGPRDTANAVLRFEKCLMLHEELAKQDPFTTDEDAQMALRMTYPQLPYIYQQLALIYESQGSFDSAVETLKEGEKVCEDDADIFRQRLSLYQSHPEKVDEAIPVFEQAVERWPDDNAILLAYGALLEQTGKSEAAKSKYQKAFDRDPQSLHANYGLGAYYVNKAAQLAADNSERNLKNFEEADQKITELMIKAYPYMKFLHEAQPTESEWLLQLINITSRMENWEEMEMYSAKLRALRN